MSLSVRFLAASLFVFVAGSVLPAAETTAGPAESAPSSRDIGSVYLACCREALSGHFDRAYQIVSAVDADSAGTSELKLLSDWLKHYHDLSVLRERLRAREYAEYVSEAKTKTREGKWLEAMDAATSAFWAAADEQEFRSEPWLRRLVEKAAAYAEDLRRRGEWNDAARVYAELATLLPDRKEFKQMRHRCAAHARLEATYSTNGEWKERLEGITPDMARDAFWRVARFYYTEPDLRKMASSGLQNLITLAETAPLFKVFHSLEDEERRLRFVGRLRGEIDKVSSTEDFGVRQLIAAFDQALSINADTVNLPEEVVVSEFVEGAFDALDKFTSMIWPAELEDFRKHTRGEFSGVGIQITMENGELTVFTPLEGTPAYEAGIEPGDVIVAIDGKSAKGITLEQAVRRITGKPGTKVVLTIRRGRSGKPFDVTITRARIKVPTVKGWKRHGIEWDYYIDRDMQIAMLRVTSFTEKTMDSFRQALQRLKDEGIRGLILDLRYNPGGLLKAAVEMVDTFLPPDKLIVSTKGRATEPWSIMSRTETEFESLPLIVLVNEFSASASEIVAGALQAHGRALLVGQRTYGKGSVQNPWPLGDGQALLKLTTALYYLPFMERSIHRSEDSKEWGVKPDVLVKLTPKESRRVLQLRRRSDIIPGKSGNLPPASAPATQNAEDDSTLDVDPQVETALLLMRIRLLSRQTWPTRVASAGRSGEGGS